MSDKFNVKIFFGKDVPQENLVMTRNELNYFVRSFEKCKLSMMSEPFMFLDEKFDSCHGFDLIDVVKYTAEPRWDELEEYYNSNTQDGEPRWN